MHLPLYKIEISGIIIIVRCASVAQSVEQGTENPRVIGSIPIGGTSQETQQGFQYAAVAHLVERHLAKVEVASSSLVGRSNTKPSSMRIAKMMAFLFDSRSWESLQMLTESANALILISFGFEKHIGRAGPALRAGRLAFVRVFADG